LVQQADYIYIYIYTVPLQNATASVVFVCAVTELTAHCDTEVAGPLCCVFWYSLYVAVGSSSGSVVKISLIILFRYQPVYSFPTYSGRFGCSTVPQFVPQMLGQWRPSCSAASW